MIKPFAADYLADLKRAIEALPLDKLEAVYSRILEAARAGRQIFIMGNGGSGATASHFAADLNLKAGLRSRNPFRAICLNDSLPAILAIANDHSFAEIFVRPLKRFLRKGDLVIGLSSSGNSENVLRAIACANRAGAGTVGLTGFDGGKLARRARLVLVVPADDCQKVEDLHLVLLHVILQKLKAEAF